jgi:hypothetical protein
MRPLTVELLAYKPVDLGVDPAERRLHYFVAGIHPEHSSAKYFIIHAEEIITSKRDYLHAKEIRRGGGISGCVNVIMLRERITAPIPKTKRCFRHEKQARVKFGLTCVVYRVLGVL